MPIEASDIEDIESARLWAVDHDATITVWWEQQHKLNTEVVARVEALERRIYWLAAACFGGGGLGAMLGPILLKGAGA